MTTGYDWMSDYKLTELQKITIDTTANRVWAIFSKYNMQWYDKDEPYCPLPEDIAAMYRMLVDMILKSKNKTLLESRGGLYVQIIDIKTNRVKFDYGMSINDDIMGESWSKVVREVNRSSAAKEDKKERESSK